MAQAVWAITWTAIGGMMATALYVLLGWWLDRYEKEPLHLVGAALLWGGIPAMAIAVLVRPFILSIAHSLAPDPVGSTWILTVLLPTVEELAKGLFLVGLFLLYRQEIDSLYDGFFYGSLVGLGFAFADTILSAPARQWGLAGGLERVLLLGLAQAFFTGWIGLGFAAARLGTAPTRVLWPILGWLAAIGFHILRDWGYNTAIWNPNLAWLQTTLYGLGLLLMVGLVVYGMSRESRWISQYLPDEVKQGTLSPALYETLRSSTGRLVYRWAPLLQGDVHTWRRRGLQLQAAAELAFFKHRFATLGEPELHAEIERLRQLLRQLS